MEIIGILAFVTIGIVVVIAVVHHLRSLKDPANRAHARNIFVDDGESATSKHRQGDGPEHAQGRTLKERLSDSPASAHPHDPVLKKQ